MFGITSETMNSIGIIIASLSGVITFFYGRIAAADKKARAAELEIIRSEHKNTTDNLQKEQDRLAASLAQAWVKVDDLRDNAVRKAELKEYRAETKQDMKDLGDRLENAIKALRDDIHLKPPEHQ